MTTIKSYVTPKIESTLKPSNDDAKPLSLHFAAPKVQKSTPFLKKALNFCTCLMCPSRAFHDCFFLSIFRWKCGIPKHPNIPKNTKT